MAFIASGSLGYGYVKKLVELFDKDPDAYRTLQASVKNPRLPLTRDELEKFDEYRHRDIILTEEELDAWIAAGISVEVSRLSGVKSNSQKLHQTVYQISVANVGLMSVQRVELLEDCCTYTLQGYLDKGWRLLAVCPPNDTRRPTYIMGHMNKDAD